MQSNAPSEQSPLRFLLILLFIIAFPLALGIFFAPRLVPKPQIGIVRLSSEIAGFSAFEINEQLQFARENDQIKAVVLVINSPGGSAAYSEELYLDVLNTREEMPVVATIDLLAASGAYYMAAAADKIYAKPTSGVGSVGVIAFLPGQVFIEEEVLTTGPYKSFGGTRDGTIRQIETAKNAFLQAVINGRGDKLEIPIETLSRAEVYTGIQALDFGLIDGLVSNDEAIEDAAEMAGLAQYDVVELFPLVFDDGETAVFDYTPPEIDVNALWTPNTNYEPGLYYLYLDLPENR
ncbi:MAG: S49 family peptidase [Chloroflexota bacterium]